MRRYTFAGFVFVRPPAAMLNPDSRTLVSPRSASRKRGNKWSKTVSLRPPGPPATTTTGSAARPAPSAANGHYPHPLARPPAAAGQHPRSSPMLRAALEVVRPDPDSNPGCEEHRLDVALLPLRVRLDQRLLDFLEAFAAPIRAASATAAAAASAATAPSPTGGWDPSTDGWAGQRVATDGSLAAGPARVSDGGTAAAAAAAPFFQICTVQGFSVLIDYRPRHVDVSALASGRLAELLNLVPWGGLDLDMRPLALRGVQVGGGSP